MTPEQADKIVSWLELRCAPKPNQHQKQALAKDLLAHDYQKTVDNVKQYSINSNWFPVVSQIAPPPELKPFKKTHKPGIKGKLGVQLIKRELERIENGKAM